MKWKNLSVWIKVGIILGIIYITLSLIYVIWDSNPSLQFNYNPIIGIPLFLIMLIISLPFRIFLFIFVIIPSNILEFPPSKILTMSALIFVLILPPLIYFLIGFLITLFKKNKIKR